MATSRASHTIRRSSNCSLTGGVSSSIGWAMANLSSRISIRSTMLPCAVAVPGLVRVRVSLGKVFACCICCHWGEKRRSSRSMSVPPIWVSPNTL